MARKAPLVASDSSSSGGSESDEEDKTESVTMEKVSKEMVTTETVVTTAGRETIKLRMDANNERAVFTRYTHTHSLLSRAVYSSPCLTVQCPHHTTPLILPSLFLSPSLPLTFQISPSYSSSPNFLSCPLPLLFSSFHLLSSTSEFPLLLRVFHPAVRGYVVYEVSSH